MRKAFFAMRMLGFSMEEIFAQERRAEQGSIGGIL